MHDGAVSEFSVTIDSLGTISWDQSLITNTAVQSTNAVVQDLYKDRLSLDTQNNTRHYNAHIGDPALVNISSTYSRAASDWYAYRLGLLIYGDTLIPGVLPEEDYGRTSTYTTPLDILNIEYGLFGQYSNGTDQYTTWVTQVRGIVDHVEFASTAAPVPETSTVLLLGSGLVGLAWYGRKRKKA